jgi:hypothetical protein
MQSRLQVFLIALFAVVEALAFLIAVPMILLGIAAYGLLICARAPGSRVREKRSAARAPAVYEPTATAGS